MRVCAKRFEPRREVLLSSSPLVFVLENDISQDQVLVGKGTSYSVGVNVVVAQTGKWKLV